MDFINFAKGGHIYIQRTDIRLLEGNAKCLNLKIFT
jgi:hypothetical protein